MEYAEGLLSKKMGDGLEWTVMTTQAPAVLNTFQMEMFIFVYIITLNCITSPTFAFSAIFVEILSGLVIV